MPAENIHLAQAGKNERFYKTFDLATTEFLDWAVTGLFYSALHYIDAYLARVKDYHPPEHKPRTRLVATEAKLGIIYEDYRRLKDQSEAARYRVKKFKRKEVEDLESKRFKRVKHHLLACLGLFP